MGNEFNIKHGFISKDNSIVNGSLTATTFYGDGSNLTGISGGTDTNYYVTGSTLNGNTLELGRNGGLPTLTTDLSQFLDNTDNFITGGTMVGNTLVLDRTNSLSAVTVDLSQFVDNTNSYVTGFTYNNSNTLTLGRNGGLSDLSVSINTLTGLTVNGSLSATTFYGDGSNLTGISTQDTFVTGATYSNNNFIFTDNNGGSFTVPINIMTGLTVSGVFSATTLYGNGSNLTGIVDKHVSGTTFNSNGNVVTLLGSGGLSNSTVTLGINTLNNLTINGSLVVTGNTLSNVFSGRTSPAIFYGDGSNLTGISSGTFTGGTVNGPTNFTNGLTANTFNISTTPQSATTTSDVILTRSTGGTVTYITQIDGYITSGSTTGNLLSATSGWTINGSYTGTSITGTYQGQNYYDDNYFYTAINDNLWIRLIRG